MVQLCPNQAVSNVHDVIQYVRSVSTHLLEIFLPIAPTQRGQSRKCFTSGSLVFSSLCFSRKLGEPWPWLVDTSPGLWLSGDLGPGSCVARSQSRPGVPPGAGVATGSRSSSRTRSRGGSMVPPSVARPCRGQEAGQALAVWDQSLQRCPQ